MDKSKYSLFLSIPINWRSSLRAMIPVVDEPVKGSKITSCFFVEVRLVFFVNDEFF